jgi:hypothetical protein
MLRESSKKNAMKNPEVLSVVLIVIALDFIKLDAMA